MREWHDKFFAGVYTKVLAHTFPDAVSRKQANGIKARLGLRRGQRALDLPCGQGRITLSLARLGIRMVGVDLQPHYIQRAKTLAKRRRLKADFQMGDMRHAAFQNEFDAAFNWFGSFGYFNTRQNQQVLANFFRALKPGGRFLLQCPNKDWIERNFRSVMEYTVGGIKVTQNNRWVKFGKTIRTDWTFRSRNKIERQVSVMRQFDQKDLTVLLKKAGFRKIRFYSDLKGNPLGQDSTAIIVVAQRPK